MEVVAKDLKQASPSRVTFPSPQSRLARTCAHPPNRQPRVRLTSRWRLDPTDALHLPPASAGAVGKGYT